MTKKKKRKSKSWGKVFLNTFLLLLAGGLSVIIYLIFLARDLPSLDELQQFSPDTISKVVAADGKLIKELYIRKRDIIRIGEVPKDLINALISMEDHRFYEHSGISIRGIVRAVIVDVITMSSKQGASTITQQLARNMYNSIGFEKTITRKLKEFLTAIQIEKTYTKAEIMELYLNSVHFGHGSYGIKAATDIYYSKDVSDLTLDECAVLIGLLPAPARYSPRTHPDRALIRRDLVLKVMHRRGYITEESKLEYSRIPLSQKESTGDTGWAHYFAEYVRRELEKIDDELNIDLYKDGLVIHTTLDSDIQNILEENFNKSIKLNQAVLNKEFLKNEKKLAFAISQARTEISADSIKNILDENLTIPAELRSQFLVQGAVVAIEPKTGKILGMIGGRQEEEYADHYNRSTQAKRQPGSVFKPFVYMTALEKGYKPTTQLLNQPIEICLDEGCIDRWNPQNHDGSTGLLTTLREGIKRSLNLISVRVVQELVGPAAVKKNAQLFGLSTYIPEVDAIALGVADVIPMEITTAYAAIANNGILSKPFAITRIEDRYGRVIKEYTTESREVKDENLIYILRDMMRSVIDEGTGGSIRWKYKFYRPLAGKTGTTNSKADAWFVGYTPQIAISVWVGMDDPGISLGEKQFGSQAALPTFANSIKEIYDLKDYPEADWEMPDGVTPLLICTDSYELATQWCPQESRINEIFLRVHMPRKECSIHSNPFQRFRDK